jgi:hypothetical protein
VKEEKSTGGIFDPVNFHKNEIDWPDNQKAAIVESEKLQKASK